MSLANDTRRLDKMLHNYQQIGDMRKTDATAFLCKVHQTMEKYQRELRIPDRSIKVFGYLANNPSALIIPDKNVKEAFEWAKKALAVR